MTIENIASGRGLKFLYACIHTCILHDALGKIKYIGVFAIHSYIRMPLAAQIAC